MKYKILAAIGLAAVLFLAWWMTTDHTPKPVMPDGGPIPEQQQPAPAGNSQFNI